MDQVERLLRLLALNDEQALENVLEAASDSHHVVALSQKTDLFVRLAALLALGASTPALRSTVDRALAAGASQDEIADVLVAVAPAVGMARVVSGAARLGAALGYPITADD